MRKFYNEPEIEVRKYVFSEDVCTSPSDPDKDKDLNDDDEYEYFPGGN